MGSGKKCQEINACWKNRGRKSLCVCVSGISVYHGNLTEAPAQDSAWLRILGLLENLLAVCCLIDSVPLFSTQGGPGSKGPRGDRGDRGVSVSNPLYYTREGSVWHIKPDELIEDAKLNKIYFVSDREKILFQAQRRKNPQKWGKKKSRFFCMKHFP